VTGPVPARPTHAARPATHRAWRLAAVGGAALVAIGVGIAGQKAAGGPVHSTPSSAQYMLDHAMKDHAIAPSPHRIVPGGR
jgi:hypothetical protein